MDPPGLEPADAQHVERGAQGAIAEAVFADPKLAGAVMDWNFRDFVAGIFNEGRQEAMGALEGDDGFDAFPAEGLERAARVMDSVSHEAAAHKIGDAAGEALDERVLAMDAMAADEVHSGVKGFEEGGNIRGIVLEIAIQKDNFGTARRAHSGDHGRALTTVFLEAQDADLRRAPDAGHCGVVRSIVHENQFVGFPFEGITDFFLEDGNIVLLVEKWDNDGKVRRGHSGSDW